MHFYERQNVPAAQLVVFAGAHEDQRSEERLTLARCKATNRAHAKEMHHATEIC